MQYYSLSDRGRVRETNQDSILVLRADSFYSSIRYERCLFLLADGMGGLRGGETASALAVSKFSENIMPSLASRGEPVWSPLLRNAISCANDSVYGYSRMREDLAGMGTTLVAALLSGTTLHIANVGDSRLYIVDSDHRDIRQATKDHSVVQEFVDFGRISREEALHHPQRGLMTRAVGVGPVVETDTFEMEILPGETILMCTDGLTEMVAEDEIMRMVLDETSLENGCRSLIDAANRAGGMDNVSVILFRL